MAKNAPSLATQVMNNEVQRQKLGIKSVSYSLLLPKLILAAIAVATATGIVVVTTIA